MLVCLLLPLSLTLLVPLTLSSSVLQALEAQSSLERRQSDLGVATAAAQSITNLVGLNCLSTPYLRRERTQGLP